MTKKKILNFGLPGKIWQGNETCKLHISWKSPYLGTNNEMQRHGKRNLQNYAYIDC